MISHIFSGEPTGLGHLGRVVAFAFSHDGTLFASASPDDRTVRVWKIENGEEVAVLQLQTDGWKPDAFFFSEDDKWLQYWDSDAKLGRQLAVSKKMVSVLSFLVALGQGEAVFQNANKVSLSVVNADLRQVVKQLCRDGDVHYAIAPDASGTVSVEFSNLPLARALTLVLREANCGYSVEGGVVIIFLLRDRSIESRNGAPFVLNYGPHAQTVPVRPSGLKLKAGEPVYVSYSWLMERARKAGLPISSVMVTKFPDSVDSIDGYAVVFPLERIGFDSKPLKNPSRFDTSFLLNGFSFSLLASALDPPEPKTERMRVVAVEVSANTKIEAADKSNVGLVPPTHPGLTWGSDPKMTAIIYEVKARPDRTGFEWVSRMDKDPATKRQLLDFGLFRPAEIQN